MSTEDRKPKAEELPKNTAKAPAQPDAQKPTDELTDDQLKDVSGGGKYSTVAKYLP